MSSCQISEADQEDPRYVQFARWDKDNSGSVDAQELESILRAIYDSGLKEGKTIEDAEGDAKALIGFMDTSGDGKVSWAEFKKALER